MTTCNQAVQIILDTDMDSDCDDTAALAVLHALADAGEAEILATATCGRNPWTPLAIDAINTYYGRPGIPVGAPRGAAPLRESRYTRTLAERCPHALPAAEAAEDAVQLYRRILEQAAAQSVTLVTIGYHTNVSSLLQLPAQGARLSGVDLVRRSVRQWVCMGGNFTGSPARDNLVLGQGVGRNANFLVDPQATFHAIRHWPSRLMFAGREVCSVPSGLQAGLRLADTPPDNPVRLAYECYFGGQVQNRHIADLVAVLFAVRGLRDYWDAHTTGHMNLNSDMTFQWVEDGAQGQGYLLKKRIDGQPNDRRIERICEDLMTRPPARLKPRR